MTRTSEVDDIKQRLAVLTLHEDDYNFDFVVDQLAGLKQEISRLSQELDGHESWLVDWLTAEHLKGSMLYVGAITNYRKERAAGRGFPFDPLTRAAIADRFNSWSNEAKSRLALYETSDRTADTVEPWVAKIRAFNADPVNNP
ncbi:hypothetical protein B7495_01000 [Cryobacterium sp. LW097]|uniref:hypothetical protein n=1 Tax=Cryobacterium sp. LW097 TaxID=1978566 RepID=UPI000B4D046C|nr:hypothetical protein [Cryobacterium sp. LW097]ASD20860.1 hypothetical protein B7495_01000 [Cryobacterium sp. LW097]